jgi:hypothetical protein
VEHRPGLIHGMPEPVLRPGNPDGDRIQVPLVPGVGEPTPDPFGEGLAELRRPLPQGLLADDDAACRRHLLEHAQAEREAMAGLGGSGGWRPHSAICRTAGQSAETAHFDGASPPANPTLACRTDPVASGLQKRLNIQNHMVRKTCFNNLEFNCGNSSAEGNGMKPL